MKVEVKQTKSLCNIYIEGNLITSPDGDLILVTKTSEPDQPSFEGVFLISQHKQKIEFFDSWAKRDCYEMFSGTITLTQ